MEKIKLKKTNVVEWTPEVVYTVYCNEDLKTLPVGILSDMKIHIQTIIDSKNGVDNKLKIQDEDYLSVKDFKGDEVLHIEYDCNMEDIINKIIKFVEHINKRS